MALDEHAYVLMSRDGKWWWDGSAWQPAPRPDVNRARLMTTPRSLAATFAMVTALVVIAALAVNLGQMQAQNAALAAQSRSEQHQIASLMATQAEMQTTIDDLRSRWIGDPALWEPSGLPSNTSVAYFDLSGTSQEDLIQAFRDADICAKYKCLVDPAVPAGLTLALEGNGRLVPNSAYCYSPSGLTYSWASHTITLPRWTPKFGTVKIELVQRWNALQAVLLTHEAGHVSVAEDWLSAENARSRQLASCSAALAFWSDPHLFDSLDAAQNAYHAKLRADCRPEIGCVPSGWMGW